MTEDGAGEVGATSHKVPEPELAFIPRAEQWDAATRAAVEWCNQTCILKRSLLTYLEKTFEFPETKMTTLDLGRQSPGWVKHYEMSQHVTQLGLRHCQ